MGQAGRSRSLALASEGLCHRRRRQRCMWLPLFRWMWFCCMYQTARRQSRGRSVGGGGYGRGGGHRRPKRRRHRASGPRSRRPEWTGPPSPSAGRLAATASGSRPRPPLILPKAMSRSFVKAADTGTVIRIGSSKSHRSHPCELGLSSRFMGNGKSKSASRHRAQ
jgi:hypothetical protein